MSDETKTITLTVNGDKVTKLVDARQHLVDFLRGELALTGSHLGCEHGAAGEGHGDGRAQSELLRGQRCSRTRQRGGPSALGEPQRAEARVLGSPGQVTHLPQG